MRYNLQIQSNQDPAHDCIPTKSCPTRRHPSWKTQFCVLIFIRCGYLYLLWKETVRIMKSVGSEDQEKHCMKITCPHDYRLHSWNPIMWCFVLLTLVWFTTGCPPVACWKYQDSMASRNCSTFNIQDYPNITVKRGDQEFNRSFSIAENHVLDHELFYIMCVAHYPIEWVANFPDPKDMVSSNIKLFRYTLS